MYCQFRDILICLIKHTHNDVVITDRNVQELLKIAKIYETTNREVMSW